MITLKEIRWARKRICEHEEKCSAFLKKDLSFEEYVISVIGYSSQSRMLLPRLLDAVEEMGPCIVAQSNRVCENGLGFEDGKERGCRCSSCRARRIVEAVEG